MSHLYLRILTGTSAILVQAVSTLAGQQCPKGTQFSLHENGMPSGIGVLRYLGDSASLKIESSDGIGSIIWGAGLAANGLVNQISMRVPQVSEVNHLIPGRSFEGVFAPGVLKSKFSRSGQPARVLNAPSKEGAMPFGEDSPLIIDLILRRVRILGGNTVRIPVNMIDENSYQAELIYTRQRSDSATFTIGAKKYGIHLDTDGSLTGADMPSGFVIVKRKCVD